MMRFQKILCPVDFSKTSSRAFEYALEFARSSSARLHLVHVVEPIISAAYDAPITFQDLTVDMEKESKRLLEKIRARGSKKGVAVTAEVRLGNIDSEILGCIKAQKADLVVMGTHGRHGFERLLMGSETERMSRHCPVPLLVVNADKKIRTAPVKASRRKQKAA